jgi:lysophospholipase L1-like esterase
MKLRIPLLLGLAGLAACTTPVTRSPIATHLPEGSHYAALGSSFAAGPGISSVEAGSPPRCARSVDNYAHQLARRRGLLLTDASCSGAMSPHLLSAWDELPAQLDALRADTRLVTVTVGGNDLGYMSGLMAASCLGLQAAPAGPNCRHAVEPDEAAYASVASRLQQIASEVRRRSPQARLVFVDYATVLPASGRCAAMPLSDEDAALSRAIDTRLRRLTAAVALENGASLLRAGELTRDHHVCAADPWMHGYVKPDPARPVAVYHPTQAGMAAVADALDRLLER